jgi:two-component system, NarL family, sensor histidine kinase UhpB
VLGGFVLTNLLVYALIGRVLKPLRLLVHGLGQMAHGAYETRLPAMSGHEGRQISAAFNGMAQSVQDSAQARLEALEATQALAENRELTQIIQARIEEERGAIARELHDEMGQQVTAIKSVGLAIARKAAGQDTMIEHSARLVMDCADKIYEGVHRLISKLRPLALDRFGLKDALQDMVDDWRLRHADVILHLTTSGNLDGFDEEVSTAVYRIVQEAVNNSLRHAHASRIDVRVYATIDFLQLEVLDNGNGVLDKFLVFGHYGVLGIKERAHALEGIFELENVKPSGIRVGVKLPITRKNEKNSE